MPQRMPPQTTRRRSIPHFLCLLLCLATALLVAPGVFADETDAATTTVRIADWMVLGPVDWPLPHVSGGDEYGPEELLAERKLDVVELWPEPGDLRSAGGSPVVWEPVAGDPSFQTSAAAPRVAWAATFLVTDRFASVNAVIDSSRPLRIFLDGEEVASQTSSGDDVGDQEASDGAEPLEASLDLVPGKHLLLVETVADAESGSWTLDAEIRDVPRWAGLRVTRSARHSLRLADLLDVDDVQGIDLSPDGRHLAVHWAHPAVPAEHRETWTEIVEVESGRVVETLRHDATGFAWSPDAESYAYVVPARENEEAHALWLAPLPTAESDVAPADVAPTRILESVEGWAGHRFLPDGTGLVMETTEEAEADEREVKRYRGLTDRWTGWRDRTHVWHVPVDGGMMRRLTVGGTDDRVADVGVGRVLLVREHYDVAERPFQRIEVLEIDLHSRDQKLDVVTLADEDWLGDARYLAPSSAEDRRVLLTGSPSSFSEAGRDPDVPADEVRLLNLYETEAYVLDPADGSVDPFTRDWDPSVNDAAAGGGEIFLVGQEGSRARIFRYHQHDDTFQALESGVDVVSTLDVSADGGTLAWVGSSADAPEAVWVREAGDGMLPDAEPRRLVFPEEERWDRVELGEVGTWTFRMPAAEGTKEGDEILGRVHLPPDFDASKKYPLIVSYYGGTVPSGRSFGGRYPKNLWAAHGYVVYVPQPSGATGFGQEFSARHVNAWGKRTADEILEGTRQFLDAHDFVDPDRVGCIGASYGGFMTMYLLSRSDIFSAGISHAGISNLSSYWGKGWWGYLYSAAASAESYPWNAPDLYVGQSPLFEADEIETPLLLLHGDADVNVPPVESHQMYTALQILGRDVELIEIGGEDHQIFSYPKRVLWMQTILAYFDAKLRDRPEWWEHLWGTESEPKG